MSEINVTLQSDWERTERQLRIKLNEIYDNYDQDRLNTIGDYFIHGRWDLIARVKNMISNVSTSQSMQ